MQSKVISPEVPGRTDQPNPGTDQPHPGGDPSSDDGYRPRRGSPVPPVPPLAPVDDTSFERFLLLERRRCERNGGHFALMLIDLEAIGVPLRPAASRDIGRRIAGVLRDTDIAGWYRNDKILGVILTTLNGVGRGLIEPILLERTTKALAGVLRPEHLARVEVTFYFFPDGDSDPVAASESRQLFYPENFAGERRGRTSRVLKRMMDIIGSLGALIAFSPVFLLTALAIRCTSAGPVFFRQKRVGMHGREFVFLKFRSMQSDSDPAIHREYVRNLIDNKVGKTDGTFKIKNDPRITPVGRFIRKTSIDELPQFLNVFRGDMSLVGPRPPIPYELENYALWHRRRILEGKPGITGDWQVHGRSRTTFDDMVRMDLRYIQNQSLWVDLRILIKTPLAVFRGDGAY